MAAHASIRNRCRALRRLTPWLLLVVAVPSLAGDEAFRFDAASLPPGWALTQTIRVPPAQLAGFAQRLGAEVEALENQVLDVGGLAARWNVITARDTGGAKRIETTMRGLRGADFVRRDGRHVYEVPGSNLLLARAVFAAAGFEESDVATYDVAFRTALVDEPDYTKVNRLFNHFLQLEAGELDEEAARELVERDTEGWTFGRTLRLRAPAKPAFDVTWTLDPEPESVRQDGDNAVYTFDEVPTRLGVPYVDVRGVIRVPSRFRPMGPPKPEATAEDVPRWTSAEATRLAARTLAAQEVEDDRHGALLLLAALQERVGYGGAMGSRDPIEEVLARGHGRCWDKSDVYIALCRAVDLPARQVAGWVPALGAGHVWTEVHLAGAGWIPVDATTPWLGTGTDYVPFFLSEDGRLPFAYLAMPRVTRRKGP